MKIAVIGDRHTVLGFQLAGAEGTVPTNDPQKTLDEYMNRDDLGVLIVTCGIADELRSQISRWKREKNFPIIVEIQEFGKELTTDRIGELLKRAVGMDISN